MDHPYRSYGIPSPKTCPNIPSKLKTSKHSVPWINREVKHTLRRKARFFKKAKKTNNWTAYRKCQKECKQKLRKAEWNHINKVFNEGLQNNNIKPFWNYAKSKKEDNIGKAPLKSKGELVSDPKGRAELLVDQFQSLFTKATDHEPPSVSSRVEEDIPTLLIGEKGVFKILDSIKVDKAAGPDELSNRVLQDCLRKITPAVTAIFKKSVESGELPSDWRNANVAPVYKKGDRHTPENYRPVSLTCVLSKKLEHIICHHMLNHLDKHRVLTSLNHGFRSCYSCETQLVVTVHELFNYFYQNKQVDTVILDFSKAFETVPPQLPHSTRCICRVLAFNYS